MPAILLFLKPYKSLCVFTLCAAVLDVAGTLYIPALTADMINTGVGNGDMDAILRKGAAMLLMTLLSGAGALTGSFLCARLSARIGRDMRNALYKASLTFSSRDFEQFGAASMVTRTLNDVAVVQQAFLWSVQIVAPVPIICLMGAAMAFSIDWQMGLLLVGIVAVVMGSAVLITCRASSIFEKLQGALDKINAVLQEDIAGVRVIRAFNKEAREEKRMKLSFEDYARSAIEANSLFFGLESLAVFFLNVSVTAILWLGGNRIGAGHMKIGDIAALTEYSVLILFYVIMAQMVIILLPRARVCMRRISAVLLHRPEIEDGTAAGENVRSAEVCRFHNAAFQFADADAATLQGLNFSLLRGQTAAIVGSTGSGKSTIAKLLLRFHDVTAGSVTFGGVDIRALPQKELRRRISYVPQKAWLFSGTIADNLRCGNENASEEEMRRALATAQADFANNQPQGLMSAVAQGSVNFSGGQKQRLSIARALIKKADLYIFDDSFSALDFKTDAALRHSLASELRDSAVLIIAQRINTILKADQIIVLEDGKICGVGRHEDLLERCEVYREIAQSQTKGTNINGK